MWMGAFTRTATWPLDGQGGMSRQGDSPEYEYRGDYRCNRLSWVVERRKSAHECLGKETDEKG